MFKRAKPIWLKKQSKEMHSYAVFGVKTKATQGLELHLAGTAFYRVYVNDTFAGAGPARTAAGYLREDIFSLDQFVKEGECKIAIEAVGYYCHSIATVKQPSCIMAELRCGNEVIAYTGKDFVGYKPGYKLQKVERYSAQRHFTEVWDYRNGTDLTDESHRAEVEVLEEEFQILDRVVPYPLYEKVELKRAANTGNYQFDGTLPCDTWRYSWKEIPDWWGIYPWEEIEHHPFVWIQQQKQTISNRNAKLPLALKKGQYAVFDFEKMEAGFICAALKAMKDSDVVIAFAEYTEGEEFQFTNMNVHNVLEYFLAEGQEKELQSFEAYTFRFVMIIVKEGEVELDRFGVLTYMFDVSNVKHLHTGDQVLDGIYRAAVRTFAHNTVDVYMDCPSRERAGWLCDSYFTAKTEYALTRETKVEDAFLENYRLFKDVQNALPKGVLPECYPADISPGNIFIPQWTMWYILEVEEYIHKRGNKDKKEEFRESIYGLLRFYKQYENEEGLLECLPSWNFVEWSKANEWTKDVNYPTNFLYAQVLESIYLLYGDQECQRRAEEVRKEAVAQSFNGRYFLDHAVRDEAGFLQRQEHSSEACQYYAVLFGGVDIEADTYRELKKLILEVFGAERKGEMPEIMEINMFIGAYLRMETLLQMGEYELLLSDVKSFFGAMEQYTGTLWEHRQHRGSQDHGFASYALVVIEEALSKMKS